MKFYLCPFLSQEVIKKIPKQKMYLLTNSNTIIEANITMEKALV